MQALASYSPHSYPYQRTVGRSAVSPQEATPVEKESPEPTTAKLEQGDTARGAGAGREELSPEQQRQLQQLQARDREVKAHEAAHMAAGAGLVRGGISLTYQTGPDGRRYAIGGEVSIDSSPVSGDPQATMEKAQQIQSAALAPAQPSATDRAVAARAARMAMEARVELARERNEAAEALPVSRGSREAMDAYRSGEQGEAASLLDQMV